MNILYLRIELSNPFDRWDYFKNLGCKSFRLSRFKAAELEHTYYSHMLLDAEVRWSIRRDHAGFEVVLGILGYGVHFHIYDTRHWNYDTNSWEVYD